MKTLLAFVIVPILLLQAARAADVPPATSMTSLSRGFTLVLKKPVEIPQGRQVVFVVQGGQVHPGLWGWRGKRFVVLMNPADPSMDFELDAGQPSCQLHIDLAESPLPARLEFNTMAYVGEMSDGRSSLYNTINSDQTRYMNCLTPISTLPGQKMLRVGDLMAAWGWETSSVQSAE